MLASVVGIVVVDIGIVVAVADGTVLVVSVVFVVVVD